MIAVFESQEPFYKIPKREVLGNEGEGDYIFNMGYTHNVLILNDSYEVEMFRRYIKTRLDINELGALSVK